MRQSCWILLEFDQFLLVTAKMPRGAHRRVNSSWTRATLLKLLEQQIKLATAEIVKTSGVQKPVLVAGDFEVALAKADVAQGLRDSPFRDRERLQPGQW